MEMWTEPRFTKRNRGTMGIMGSISTWLGVALAIVGVVGDANDAVIGLDSISWFLVAIASLILSLGCWLGWAVGIYLHAKETESKK